MSSAELAVPHIGYLSFDLCTCYTLLYCISYLLSNAHQSFPTGLTSAAARTDTRHSSTCFYWAHTLLHLTITPNTSLCFTPSVKSESVETSSQLLWMMPKTKRDCPRWINQFLWMPLGITWCWRGGGLTFGLPGTLIWISCREKVEKKIQQIE